MAYAHGPVTLTSRRFSLQACLGWLLAASVGAVASTAYHALDRHAEPGSMASATPAAWWNKGTGTEPTCAVQADTHNAQQLRLLAAAIDNDTSPQSLLDKVAHPPSTSPEHSTDEADVQRLMTLARSDPSLRQQLMTRYTSEADPTARSRLASLLIATATPDIVRFASDMLGKRDNAQRQQGLAILASVQMQQPEARQALLSALETETDPGTLSMVVQSLVPGETRAPQDAQAMIDKLSLMAHRNEPQVRSAALGTLAQWGGPASENSIVQALADTDESVVESAIDALNQLGGRGNPANDALLSLAERADLPSALRQQAMAALNRANLDIARYERLERLRKDPRLTG